MNILKILVVGLIASCATTQAANPTAHQPSTLRTFSRGESIDVAVHFVQSSGIGNLAGVAMVDGQPSAGQRVELLQNRGVAATATSDDQGRFSFRLHKGGGYLLRLGSNTVACRVWSAKTAPPSAIAQVLLNGSTPVIRGQEILYDTGQSCDTCNAPQGVPCDCGSCNTCGSGNCGGGCGTGGWFGNNTHLLWGLAGGAIAGYLIDANNDDDVALPPAS